MKYVFFREYYYHPVCIGHYDNDAVAEREAQKLADEKGTEILVVRHLSALTPAKPIDQQEVMNGGKK